MPAAAPVSVSPLAVTVLPAPTVAVANAAVPVQPTTSPATKPVNVQLASVALVVPSYVLFDAVTDGATDFWFTVSEFAPDEPELLESPANDALTPVG